MSNSSAGPPATRDPAPSVLFALLAAFASVLFGGLAAGISWCLLAQVTDFDTAALIVPLACALAIYLRWQGYARTRGALCAIAATLLAFAYAHYLFAAIRIAQMLGFPLRNTLFKTDFALAWQVARANIGAADVVLLVVACAIATWLMMRRVNARRPRPSP